MNAPNPETTSTLAPMLSVRRGASAIEFYRAAFGAVEVLKVVDEGSGELVARLSIGGAEFWLADESPGHGNFSPETLNAGTVRMVLTVADRVVDPFGHHWEIGWQL